MLQILRSTLFRFFVCYVAKLFFDLLLFAKLKKKRRFHSVYEMKSNGSNIYKFDSRKFLFQLAFYLFIGLCHSAQTCSHDITWTTGLLSNGVSSEFSTGAHFDNNQSLCFRFLVWWSLLYQTITFTQNLFIGSVALFCFRRLSLTIATEIKWIHNTVYYWYEHADKLCSQIENLENLHNVTFVPWFRF